MTIVSFLIVLFGALNWLSIGMFQYDIVAGLFGFQGSIFSRTVYIIIGAAGLWLTYAVIRYKGRLTIKKAKKNDKKIAPLVPNTQQNEPPPQPTPMQQQQPQPQPQTVQQPPQQQAQQPQPQPVQPQQQSTQQNNDNNGNFNS